MMITWWTVKQMEKNIQLIGRYLDPLRFHIPDSRFFIGHPLLFFWFYRCFIFFSSFTAILTNTHGQNYFFLFSLPPFIKIIISFDDCIIFAQYTIMMMMKKMNWIDDCWPFYWLSISLSYHCFPIYILTFSFILSILLNQNRMTKLKWNKAKNSIKLFINVLDFVCVGVFTMLLPSLSLIYFSFEHEMDKTFFVFLLNW